MHEQANQHPVWQLQQLQQNLAIRQNVSSGFK
jgi:hypothetical protein